MATETNPTSPWQAFGENEDSALKKQQHIQSYMGLVLGAEGKGGSGVYIQLQNGKKALLTAKHVVLFAILSGDLSINLTCDGFLESFVPEEIHIDLERDAALICVSKTRDIPYFLSYEEWSRNIQISPKPGEGVICSGAPGEKKSDIDQSNRTIGSITILHYWCGVLSSDENEIVADVDSSDSLLPRSLGGMSGGPAMNLNLELLGIAKQEAVDPARGVYEITILRLQAFVRFLEMRGLPERTIPDHQISLRTIQFTYINLIKGVQEEGAASVTIGRSISAPDSEYGKFCKINAVILSISKSGSGFPMNSEYFINLESLEDKAILEKLSMELFFRLGSQNLIRLHPTSFKFTDHQLTVG